MRKYLARSVFCAGIGFFALPAQGAIVPMQGSGDPHIHVVDFDPAQVVLLQGTLGYQTLVEFAPDEHIENVAVGDAMSWQITPNRKADLLFVKPMNEAPVTNMTVVTNLRHYLFELQVRPRTGSDDKSIVYTLRFQYPETAMAIPASSLPPAAPQPPPPQVVNEAYSFDGSPKVLPVRVFDDGHATFFQFREGEEYPAIFSMDANKSEVVVNSYMRGGYVAVDRVALGFVLRQGKEATYIYNDGFKNPVPGPLSPKPRLRKCWLLCL
jgi:type IV secretion system protein VirB9